MRIYKSPMMMSMLALFIVLVGATVYRVITALETHPGLVVEDAYVSGERYGETLNNRNQLLAQGWKLDLVVPKTVTHNISQTYTAHSTKNKETITDVTVTAYFYRPLEPKYDFSTIMEADASGVFKTEVVLPFKGRWDIVVEATKQDFLQRTAAKMFAQ